MIVESKAPNKPSQLEPLASELNKLSSSRSSN